MPNPVEIYYVKSGKSANAYGMRDMQKKYFGSGAKYGI